MPRRAFADEECRCDSGEDGDQEGHEEESQDGEDDDSDENQEESQDGK